MKFKESFLSRGLCHKTSVTWYDPENQIHPELVDVSEKLTHLLFLRKEYQSKKGYSYYQDEKCSETNFENQSNKHHFESNGLTVHFQKGVFNIHTNSPNPVPLHKVTTFRAFQKDLAYTWKICSAGSTNTFANTRLQLLQTFFRLYKTMNWKIEYETIRDQSPDFGSVMKADNHIHASAAMSASSLLKFMKDVLTKQPDLVVDSNNTTLKQLMDSMGIDVETLNTNQIFEKAPSETFKRFDKFNEKYKLFGMDKFRKLFLKYDNSIQGDFLGKLLKKEIEKGESKNVLNEFHISVYGTQMDELETLSKFVITHGLIRDHVRFLIQVPRLFDGLGSCASLSLSKYFFNIFNLFFKATQNPGEYPEISEFLSAVVGFDSVDDESISDQLFDEGCSDPDEVFPIRSCGVCRRKQQDSVEEKDKSEDKGTGWFAERTKERSEEDLEKLQKMDSITSEKAKAHDKCSCYRERTPYSHYIYFLWANISQLNYLRKAKGLNTFALRPHAGEAGETHHLATTFLLADSINHGIQLKESPSLCYLYYLTRIGCSISLSSNNYLFKSLEKSPFRTFFEQGLNVTISTDDPLQFHLTDDPLIEEYAIARQYYKLSDCDMLEIARNSLLQCGVGGKDRERLLGPDYRNKGLLSYCIKKNGVSWCKARYREHMHFKEMEFLQISLDKSMEKLFLYETWVEFGESWEVVCGFEEVKKANAELEKVCGDIKMLRDFHKGDKGKFIGKKGPHHYLICVDGGEGVVFENVCQRYIVLKRDV